MAFALVSVLSRRVAPHKWASPVFTLRVLAVASPIFSNFGSLPVAPPLSFNGVVSDVAFTSVTLSAVQAGNLQFTQLTVAAVPEPAAAAMWLFGLAGLSLLLCRRAS